MSYSAKNLEEIASMFDHYAKDAKFSAANTELTGRVAQHHEGESYAWTQAAYILRRVTLTEPVHTETKP